MSQNKLPGFNQKPGTKTQEPITCLGMEFESDEARREYFTEELRQKLQDPEFRAIEGFPLGEDEDILALSDPPYYTACPNPWIFRSTPPPESSNHGDSDSGTDLKPPSVQVDKKARQGIPDTSAQVVKLTEKDWQLLKLCEVPRSLGELQDTLGYSNRGYFKKNLVNPLISSGLIKMTKPDKPTASDQKYVLTEGGFRLVHNQ